MVIIWSSTFLRYAGDRAHDKTKSDALNRLCASARKEGVVVIWDPTCLIYPAGEEATADL